MTVRCVLVLVLAAAALALSADALASGRTQALSLYAVPTLHQYINNTDDRARGQGANPFGNSSTNVVATDEKSSGPFPGDTGIYAFDLSSDAHHSHHAGSAIFVCQYTFEQQDACDAFLTLAGGGLIAKGDSSFGAARFTLNVTGGTGGYAGLKGEVSFTAQGIATQPQPVARAAPMLQSQQIRVSVRPAASTGAHKLVVYTNPAEQDFVTNADDLARGLNNNPFGRHEHIVGKLAPFPGDMALYSFTAYDDAGLKTKIGSAVITCYYAFRQNAFCDGSFQLAGGTLIAAGSVDFSAKTFTLGITGGYGTYANAAGELQASASGKRAQRLAISLR